MKARMVIALLSLVGTFVALYLTLYKIGVIGQLSCSVGSCEAVNTSQWAVFLGLPVAAWGLGAYIVMLCLALAGIQPALEESRAVSWALVAVSSWSLLFSLWLTYLELFVIHAICMYCVISAVIVALLFIASVADLRTRAAGGGRREARNLEPGTRDQEVETAGII
ncbi:MAG: vitamin K epoxide reductase family protein [Gemmatimonadaceae bacterium]|nr:vitamin K epoxide reductase family protein [Gemmatimonadaceae bacterium]MDQ3520039.1 vitamin K epoxide reductase family protein [Gemmatimonadota bacterium]